MILCIVIILLFNLFRFNSIQYIQRSIMLYPRPVYYTGCALYGCARKDKKCFSNGQAVLNGGVLFSLERDEKLFRNRGKKYPYGAKIQSL